jgi:hypothetical protein
MPYMPYKRIACWINKLYLSWDSFFYFKLAARNFRMLIENSRLAIILVLVA